MYLPPDDFEVGDYLIAHRPNPGFSPAVGNFVIIDCLLRIKAVQLPYIVADLIRFPHPASNLTAPIPLTVDTQQFVFIKPREDMLNALGVNHPFTRPSTSAFPDPRMAPEPAKTPLAGWLGGHGQVNADDGAGE